MAMASILTNKAMWRAVIITVAIHYCTSYASTKLWGQVAESFRGAVPAEYMAAFDDDNETDNATPADPASSFTSKVSRGLAHAFVDVVCQLLDYHWQCWLERKFPARARSRDSVDMQQLREKDKPIMEGSEELEEEIMRKLIAQGKVQRATISWTNTFIKWFLDNFVGTCMFGVLATVLHGVTRLNSPYKIWSDIGGGLLLVFMGHFFSLDPFYSLLNFTLVPVQHRVPAEAAMQCITSVFFGSIMYAVVPWLMKLEAVQEGMRSGAEMAEVQKAMLEKSLNKTANGTDAFNVTEAFFKHTGEEL